MSEYSDVEEAQADLEAMARALVLMADYIGLLENERDYYSRMAPTSFPEAPMPPEVKKWL